MFRNLLKQITTHRTALVEGCIMPDSARCVQCGICSYNCPAGIDIRRHSRTGEAVHDSHCLTCGECVERCPRGVLRIQRVAIFDQFKQR